MQSLERAQTRVEVYAIEPDTSRALHLKTAGPHPRSTVPALTRSATPAFKHTINVVANCVSGIHAAKSLH